MILDRLEHWRRYGLAGRLADALEWLEGRDWTEVGPGRHEIDGERMFALVSEYSTKVHGPLEVHRRYADVQFVAMGAERLAWSPDQDLAENGEFDAERDIGFLHGEGMPFELSAGWFVVLLPGEPHAPGLHPSSGPSAVLKAVVKVLMAD